METRWLYTTSENFDSLREASKDTCLIPMGCVEKHGLHLPLGTDIIEASRIAYLASQLEPVCVFPDFIFGDVPENYPTMPAGSVTLPLETEMLLLEQLCEQIARNGFKKILILNCHGGNHPWLSAFLRKLENKPHDYVLMFTNTGKTMETMAERLLQQGSGAIEGLTEEDERTILRIYEEKPEDGHGGWEETSFILGTAPESVRLDRLGTESGLSLHLTGKYKKAGIQIRDGGWGIDYPNAYHGADPVGINERIGKAAVQTAAEVLANKIKIVKEDEDLIKWHNQNWNSNL